MTILERLERLERQNRWMRRIGAVGIALAAVVLLMGQGEPKELPDLEVRSLRLKDLKGKTRAALALVDGSPLLMIQNNDGAEQVQLSATGIVVHQGELVTNLSAAGLLLGGETATALLGATDLTFSNKGRSQCRLSSVLGLTLYDVGGKARVQLSSLGVDGPRLALSDKDGKVIWKAPGG